jgi:hypothetical protein
MAFKLKSQGSTFKMMGSSPVRNMKDDPSNEVDAMKTDTNMYSQEPVETKKNAVTEKPVAEVKKKGTAGDLSNAVVKAPKPVEKSLSEGLDATKESTEEEKLRAQSKKEMYANAWQNSGAGHITEAVKSIRRGIKNIRTKNKAKKAEKLTSAKEAVGSGTETLKQAKTVERNRKKTDKLALNKIKSDAKDKEKLAEYRKKNPVRGKEAINLLANQTKKL